MDRRRTSRAGFPQLVVPVVNRRIAMPSTRPEARWAQATYVTG